MWTQSLFRNQKVVRTGPQTVNSITKTTWAYELLRSTHFTEKFKYLFNHEMKHEKSMMKHSG